MGSFFFFFDIIVVVVWTFFFPTNIAFEEKGKEIICKPVGSADYAGHGDVIFPPELDQ